MLPDFVPLRLEIIYATGIVEWIFALLLFVPSVRRKTGNWIVWYLVLIWWVWWATRLPKSRNG
ncbi:hypothetical protein ASF12_06780 [Paenibacillus sp. Leaf72]|nr:hypothetical protein ASF12_06780 [Paenibacillus sp. Leaf72]